MKRFDIGKQENNPKQLDLRKYIKVEKETPESVEPKAPEKPAPTSPPDEIFPEETIPKKPEIKPVLPPSEDELGIKPTDFWREKKEGETEEQIKQLFKEVPEEKPKKVGKLEIAKDTKETKKPKSKKSLSPKWILAIKGGITAIIIIALIGTALFSRAFFTGANIFDQEGTNTLEQIKHLVLSENNQLIGEEEDRVNVLLLGMGGEGHDGAMLTDTLIVMSIKPSTGQIAMLSLPRDMWVETNEFGYSRINKVNYYGEQEIPDKGPEYTRNLVQEITGLEIPYYLRIDFEGFREIVDSLGGVDVEVENGFIDKDYPGANYGYMTVEFERGNQHLDGEKALEYARSRHGIITDADPESEVESEGSDFARSRRQQKLIAAIKDKAMSTGTLANPRKLNSLFKALEKNILTNAQMWEGLRLFDLTENYDINSTQVSVISNEEFLKVYITADGAYTLIPREGFNNYEKIIEFAQNIFDRAESLEGGNEIAIPAENQELSDEEKARLEENAERAEESNSGYEELAEIEENEENTEEETAATVAVQNGTTLTGLASKTAGAVRAGGYEVITFGNASNQTNTTTTIYDNTNGEKIRAAR